MEIEKALLTLHRFGIGPGDRIAFHLPPSPELIALFFAAWKLGASVCPLNTRLPPAQIEEALARLSPKLFLSEGPPRVFSATPSAPASVFLFTSGSTARPKIAVLSLESLLANATHSVPLEPGDRWLLSLPLYHVGGLGILLRCHLTGATPVFDPSDPSITHLSWVPTHLYRMTPVYPRLKYLLLGGAPFAAPYPQRLPLTLTYGLTEMGSMVAARLHPPLIDGVYHLGPPLPGREVRIALDGEILVRGKTLFSGYWENNSLTPPPEWFPTGDLGKWHPTEGLAIVGRKDWQFISGGENIQPEEIETHLLQMPSVLEAAVIAKPDPEFGARPVAFVKASSPLTLSQVTSFLEQRLPKYKLPIALHQLDSLPQTNFKIDRRKLLVINDMKTTKIRPTVKQSRLKYDVS